MTIGGRSSIAATDRILAAIPGVVPVIDVGPGVYRPSVDSALLCRHAVAEVAGRGDGPTVVELCAGSGIASIYAALAGGRVRAVDDRPEALAAVASNAERNGVTVATEQADVTRWTPRRAADVVVANPPYVPAPPAVGDDGHAWDAGPDGRHVLDPIIGRAPALVAPGGALILVHSAVAGVDATVNGLRGKGFDAAVIDELALDFGPVMSERATWLEDRRLIEPGRRVERLVVVRAIRPLSGVR